jgi:hypothetical protein
VTLHNGSLGDKVVVDLVVTEPEEGNPAENNA